MAPIRKIYMTELKVSVVKETLREEKSFSSIASEILTNLNVISHWRAEALVGLPTLIENR